MPARRPFKHTLPRSKSKVLSACVIVCAIGLSRPLHGLRPRALLGLGGGAGWEGGTGVHTGFNPLHDTAAAYSEHYAELTFFGLFNLGVCKGLEAGLGTPATYAGCYLELAFGPWRVGLEGGVSTDGPYAGGFGAAAHSLGAEWPQ